MTTARSSVFASLRPGNMSPDHTPPAKTPFHPNLRAIAVAPAWRLLVTIAAVAPAAATARTSSSTPGYSYVLGNPSPS